MIERLERFGMFYSGIKYKADAPSSELISVAHLVIRQPSIIESLNGAVVQDSLGEGDEQNERHVEKLVSHVPELV